MKIVFAIAGFVTGIMLGLLLGLVEMRLLSNSIPSDFLPFVVGITVILCIITCIRLGIKAAKRKING